MRTATQSVSAPPRPPRPPRAVKKGIAAAYALLDLIHTTMRQQVESGDTDIAQIGRLLLQRLPDPTSEEATGFAFVLGEYLASSADGLVLDPDFTPLNAAAWQGVHRELTDRAGGAA